MQSSRRIYKNYKQSESAEPKLIPVMENPVVRREHSSAGQAESLIRQSKQRADELVRLAEQESNAIISRARDEAAEVVESDRKKAYESGYKSGSEDGYKDGFQAGKTESAKESRRIISEAKKVLRTAHSESREYIGRTEEEIIELSVKIAESLIKKELQLDDSIIVGIAKSALAEVRDRKQIVISAGKRESMVLQNHLHELREICPNGVFTILKDETVPGGGCLVETEIHVIDATVDRQLENVRKVLADTRQKNGK